MKRISYMYETKAHVEFTKVEIDMLMECSAGHYDSTCKSISKQGGFLYGINNTANFNHAEPQTGDRVLTSRELGLLVKVMEVSELTGKIGHISLYMKLRTMLAELAAENEKINK